VKIAFLVPNFSKIDGGARVAEVHATELADEGNDVAIFALAADIKPKNAALHVIGMPQNMLWRRVYRLTFPLDIVKTIRWLPRLKNFDMVIAYFYPLTWLGYLAKKFYRVKYTFWYVGLSEPQLYTRLNERIYIRIHKFLTRFTTRNVDRAVAISKYSQQELKKNTGLDSEIVYCKVDMKRFHPGIDGSEIRKKHGIGNNPVILFVGALHSGKGVHLLIQAFELVRENLPKAKLVIGGRPDHPHYFEELKRLSSDSVIFTGFVDDALLPLYYNMCDIYATCSLQENFNLPLVEAQMCGKPVVAFNLGSHPEVIDKNGILVESGNIEKFAAAIITIRKQQAG
jgi:glycosyltransferase involved in cell wall biosynthesis